MSIILLDDNLLKHIYSYLKLCDKPAFSLTNRKLHTIFYHYPLFDTIFRINHHNGYIKQHFLFRNIVNITVTSTIVDNKYLNMFGNLRYLDVSQVEFPSLKKVQNLVNHLPRSVINVIVMDDSVKELFKLGANFYQRTFHLKISKKRPPGNDLNVTGSSKRLRTPSPVCHIADKKLEECLLHRSRLKYACLCPEDFIPAGIFQKFPQLRNNNYTAAIDTVPIFDQGTMNKVSVATMEAASQKLKDMLVHSVVQTQSNHWIFVTQVEVYYHDKEIDDVAQVDEKNEYTDTLTVKMEKRQEGRGSWYELCFWCQRFEIVATGGLCNHENGSRDKLDAFLGVTIPSFIGKDSNPIFFSPNTPVQTVSCIRMLRNYKKEASLKKLCFKSSFFLDMDFTTPDQLNLYEEKEPNNGFISVCSKLINLAVYYHLNEEEYQGLENLLIKFEYWKSLGFEDAVSKDEMMSRLDHFKRTIKRGLSISKRLLVELVLTKQLNLNASILMTLYNGLIYPRVKSINKKRVKKMQEQLL
ncbi:hypothetical protein BD770DRAFT_390152 [Pilaira anomala]|nr:hypothetical protein BD770DRAFT_390152 [Pilaira anomala]